MTDLRHPFTPRHAVLVLTVALMLGAPARGQGAFPPVPGPFPVMPGAVLVPPMPSPEAPVAGSAPRPLFQPPANAMRMPYWMQAPQPVPPASTRREAATDDADAPARTAGQYPTAPGRAVTGYAPPVPSWTAPAYGSQGYGAQGYGAMGYGAQGSGAMGTAPQGFVAQAPGARQTGTAPTANTAPGTAWGMPQQQMQPGWGYGAAPWGPAPYAPAPGWGWAAPVTGATR